MLIVSSSFFSQPVRHLLRATDIDVAVLASEVLFNLCVPSNSIINSLNDDYYDLVEVNAVLLLAIKCE